LFELDSPWLVVKTRLWLLSLTVGDATEILASPFEPLLDERTLALLDRGSTGMEILRPPDGPRSSIDRSERGIEMLRPPDKWPRSSIERGRARSFERVVSAIFEMGTAEILEVMAKTREIAKNFISKICSEDV
jgi:hypothetical protein